LPGKRDRLLLAYLALRPNHRQTRRNLATLLWGDASDETAQGNLRTCLWGVRKALGEAGHRVLTSEGEDLVLNAAAFEIDALTFRRLAARPDRIALEQAVEIYAGEFLEGLSIESEEFESWRREEAARFRNQTIDALSRLMSQLAEGGENERAVEAGLRILRLEPLCESTVRSLMRLYAETGRRGSAIQLYRSLEETLRTELDVQPESETRAVLDEVSRWREHSPRTNGLPTSAITLPSPSALGAPAATAVEQPGASPRRPQSTLFGRRAPFAIGAGVSIIAAALFIFYPPSNPFQRVVAERAASASEASSVSVAVLPFLNLSADPDQQFFSDGMTEEITTALARVPGLKVVARTSALRFKDQTRDIQSIGRQLHASHLIEGSVRRAGDRVRVAVQLVGVKDGINVWANDYDRELSNVFAIQEEIARSVADALRTPLGLKPGEHLVSSHDIDPESYVTFLRARALIQRRGLKPLKEATGLLERVVARHPDFAPAWSTLAGAYDLIPNATEERSVSAAAFRRSTDLYLSKALAAAQRTIQLEPDFAEGYVYVGAQLYQQGKPLQAEEYYSKALALDPTGSSFLHGRSEQLAALGRLKEALVLRQQLQDLEPFVPVFNDVTAAILWLNGRNEEAIALAKELPPNRKHALAMIYASLGRYGESLDALREIPPGTYPPGRLEEAERILSTAPAKADLPEKLPALGILPWVYLHVGASDRVLDEYEAMLDGGRLPGQEMDWLWHPSYAPVRKTERFKAFVRKAGFVDYWRAKGWPDLCHPIGSDDFECR
jgi:TolB-like protein/DNA-binding SARP family transcriptional activator